MQVQVQCAVQCVFESEFIQFCITSVLLRGREFIQLLYNGCESVWSALCPQSKWWMVV